MSRQILIVEAHADLRTVIAEALTRADYRCDAVESARDALLQLRRSDYSLILLDVDAPESMRVLYDTIDADPVLSARLVIISEGDAGTPSHPTLLKPFDTRELLARIRR